MPVYEYECPEGHKFERVVQFQLDEPKEKVRCKHVLIGQIRRCPEMAVLVPSRTGKPILKAGKVGGFYAPTSQ